MSSERKIDTNKLLNTQIYVLKSKSNKIEVYSK